MICAALSVGLAEAKTIAIVPKPVKMEMAEGKGFELSAASKVCVQTKELAGGADIFAAQVKDIAGFAPAVKNGTGSKNAIAVSVDRSLAAEGYTLSVSDGAIEIKGGSSRGAFYGLQTLRQVILQCYEGGKVVIPAMRIEDAPFFAYRGMMLDVCRHFRDVAEVKRYIDILSMHKLNTFHWHLTDDQGWRIAVDKYPLLTTIGAERAQTVVGHARTSKEYDGKPYGKGMFYTREQIKEVVDYAAARYIDIIPEIEMPGHALAALAAYPQLGCTGKEYKVSPTFGVFDDVFCAGKEETFRFFEEVLSEVIGLFPYKYIHIGGDECPKTRWKECPLCQQRIKDNALADEHELQSYFMKRIEKFVDSKGRSIIGWEEILEGGVSPTATVMAWKSPQAGVEAAKRGNKVIMVNSKFSYLDYYQSEDQANEPMAIGGFVPVSKVYTYDPYTDLNQQERQSILGVQANLWTEYIPQMKGVEYMVLPRMAAMAENGWSYQSKNYEDFEKRMQVFRALYDLYGYNYARHIFKTEPR